MVLVLLVISNSATIGASPDEIKLTTPFPRIEISAGHEIQLEININNLGTQYETLSLEVLKPENWEATLRSTGYVIKMVSLAPGENRSVELIVSPPLEENFGSHTIEIKAFDEKGNVRDSLDIILDFAEVSPLGILLSTPNPSIEGPAGEDFKFTVDVRNETGEERDIVLSSVHPANWTITFMPRYELTLIRAVHLEAGERKALEVTISPSPDAEAGDYDIVVV
ncbi:MAG: NEW3 domain-containing protein, partial [Elusimicrobiota bacterium]|nr:NEW3 domain-containing protein [Elusimicrobiota bacterium]